MNVICLINGCGTSGKDTFIEYCKEYFKYYTINVLNYSTIDLTNKAAIEYLGWDGKTKDEKYRKFMSDLKKVCKEFNNLPVNYILDQIKNINTINNNVVFIHSREIPEICEFNDIFKQYKDLYNILDCITILVKRQNIQITSNDSDKYVEDYEYDYYILNNGTIELLDQLSINFVQSLITLFNEHGYM